VVAALVDVCDDLRVLDAVVVDEMVLVVVAVAD
jgi:hypothetical protein